MRVVVLSETYPKRMGYLVTMLPKYLAKLGAEVHLIVLDLPPYHYMADAKQALAPFFAGHIPQAGSTEHVDGYTVHVLKHRRVLGYPSAVGFGKKLRELAPDVVYSSVAIGWLPLQAVLCRLRRRFCLFLGSHTAASMFPLARSPRPWMTLSGLKSFVSRWIPGRLISLFAHKCYAPTGDCAEIAVRFFGVQAAKVCVLHLGVDHEVFRPAAGPSDEHERSSLRERLGFEAADIVCLYSGKLSSYKNPQLLARAVESLRAQGYPFRALFVGEGPEEQPLSSYPSSVVVPFMPYDELAPYYRACDIAVWPVGESTSMLDAAATGLPLVVSDRIYRDHVDGNGVVYLTNDCQDLERALRQLASKETRAALAREGVRKMRQNFDWALIARRRLDDFSAALALRPAGHI
jgi:glycosyltransferase involved in cell wall biosynthesis